MIKLVNYFFQSIIIYFFLLFSRIIGLKTSRKIFSILFIKIGPFFKSNKIIENNFNICSNQIPLLDKKMIIKKMWANYGKTFVEYIFLNNFVKKNSHVKIYGEENLLQVMKNGKPVIFISGHFANFELMSMEITKKKIPLATIYRPLNNIFLNPFMEFLRKKYVCKNQIKKGLNGVREAIEFVNKKYSIALMIDQRVSEGEKINFFGKEALTTTLPAQLSMKYNLDIIPVFIERDKDDTFKINFQKEISPKNFSNKTEFTLELNRVLEKMIIKNPSQWIWTHNRWK